MKQDTLLLIPGSACDEEVWKNQLDSFSTIFHTHVPDLSHCNNLDEMVEQSIQSMPEKFLLAGHSLGGCIALEIMRKATARVKKSCLLSTSAAVDDEQTRLKRLERISTAQTGNYPELAYQLANQYTYDKSMVEEVFQMFLRNRKLFIQQQKNIIERQDSQIILKNIHQDTLLIVGKQDPYFYESTKAIAASIPHASFEVIEECGHMLTMEKPKVITELMLEWAHDR